MKNNKKNLFVLMLSLALAGGLFPGTGAKAVASDSMESIAENSDAMIFEDFEEDEEFDSGIDVDDFDEEYDEDGGEDDGVLDGEDVNYSDDEVSEGAYLVGIKADKDMVYYETGDELDLDDITVTATYSDGAEVTIDIDECELNDDEIDMDEAGIQTLIVSYTEDDITVTAEIEIEIEEAVVLEEIKAKKTKTTYFVGEKIKLNDLKVTAYYSDGSKEELDLEDVDTNISSLKTKKAGTLKLKITYEEDDEEVSAEIKIIVKAKTKAAAKTLAAPAKVSASSSGKKVTVKFGKVSGAAGYAVTYSTSSNFKSSKVVYVAGKNKTQAALKNLSAGTYYIKVSAYTKNGKNKVLGKASAAKKVKVTVKTKKKNKK